MELENLQSSMFLLLSFMKNDNNSNNMQVIMFMFMLFQLLFKLLNTKYIKELFDNIINNKNNYCKIIIKSHQVNISRGFQNNFIKNVYSDKFMAIIYYLINNNIEYDNLNEIMSFSKDYDNPFARDKTDNKYIFLPITKNKILLNSDLDIYFELISEITCDDDSEDDKSNKKSNKITKNNKNYIIELSIKKSISMKNSQLLNILNNFIDTCLTKYLLVKNYDFNDKELYIYQYKGFEKNDENNNMELQYNKYLLQHNKDLNTNIFFENKDELIRYIEPFIYNPNETFNKGEELYIRSGFTFKAGLLFYGYPGCGKTSTIKAILKHTNRHGIIINLNKIKTCQELENVFRNRIFNEKELVGKQLCYILEDCDAFDNNIITTRNNNINDNNNTDIDNPIIELATSLMCMNNTDTINIKNNNNDDKINLSCFLNILDGIIELHGIMIIMTTNYPDKIDEALIRPGRFDFKYEFKKTTKKIIKEMLAFKFDIPINNIDAYTNELIIKDYTLTPAEIQSICFKNNNIYECVNDIVLYAQNK